MNAEPTPHEHFLIVGIGATQSRIAADLHPGAELTVMGRSSMVGRMKMHDRAARSILLRDGSSDADWIEAATFVHVKSPITKVWCFNDPDQDKAALIAAALGIPGPDATCVKRMHDKLAMREALSSVGINSLQYAAVDEGSTVEAVMASVDFPFILKPRIGVGSTGIEVVRDAVSFADAFASARERSKDLDSLNFIAESLLGGKEYSAECVTTDGEHSLVCVTEKRTNDSFVEVGHLVPAPLDDAVAATIEAFVKRVLDALEVKEGVTHTEFMLDGDRVQIIESHLRPAGDEIPEMVKDVIGVDLERQNAEIQANMSSFEHMSYAQRLASVSTWQAVEFLFSPGAGTIDSYRGLTEVQGSEGYAGHDFVLEPGDEITATTSSFSRLALVRANGSSPQDAQRLAHEALGKLQAVITVSAT